MADIMTDNLGTLAGLIADLEKLHQLEGFRSEDFAPTEGAKGSCFECADYWPCPTIELTRKHKRGQWRLGKYSDSKDVPERTHFVMNINRGGYPPFDGTEAECEAWIEKQVSNE